MYNKQILIKTHSFSSLASAGMCSFPGSFSCTVVAVTEAVGVAAAAFAVSDDTVTAGEFEDDGSSDDDEEASEDEGWRDDSKDDDSNGDTVRLERLSDGTPGLTTGDGREADLLGRSTGLLVCG